MKIYTYLALGDSYTIGEKVSLFQSFPYQAVQLLRQKGYNFTAPEIVATTGWTTGELQSAIEATKLLPTYTMVTLLIGVNNQYRGRPVEEFRMHFRYLLEQALRFADNIARHVTVLSIPDWSVTPYAANEDRNRISSEIDLYNFICQAEAAHFQTNYIDITTSQRADGHSSDYLASDRLHPGGKEYLKWAEKLSAEMENAFETTS
ncbi:MAG: GDSL-type esterase/lipase family protein [Bacteroidota bacterium]